MRRSGSKIKKWDEEAEGLCAGFRLLTSAATILVVS
jgi:hypothetical protein